MEHNRSKWKISLIQSRVFNSSPIAALSLCFGTSEARGRLRCDAQLEGHPFRYGGMETQPLCMVVRRKTLVPSNISIRTHLAAGVTPHYEQGIWAGGRAVQSKRASQRTCCTPIVVYSLYRSRRLLPVEHPPVSHVGGGSRGERPTGSSCQRDGSSGQHGPARLKTGTPVSITRKNFTRACVSTVFALRISMPQDLLARVPLNACGQQAPTARSA